MPSRLVPLAFCLFFLLNNVLYAAATMRTPQFANDQVAVWKTVIYPSTNQVLKMHNHTRDRVLVAFTDGVLKVTNDKGNSHYLRLEKDKAYYLAKDTPNELHSDQNMSSHPVKLLVIELKKG